MNNPSSPGGARGFRAALWPLGLTLLYSLITIVHVFPVIQGFSTHVFGSDLNGDTSLYYWSQWYIGKALRGEVPFFQTNYLYYPYGLNLAFTDQMLLHGVLGSLLAPWLGSFGAFNLLLLLTFPITALGVYLLAREAGAGKGGAFLGGYFFAFCPFRMHQLLGRQTFMAAEAIPFFALFFLRTLRRRGAVWPLLAGLCLALTGYAGGYFLVFLVFFALAALIFHPVRALLSRFGASRGDAEGEGGGEPEAALVGWPLVGRLVLLGSVFLVLYSPVLIQVPIVRAWQIGSLFAPEPEHDPALQAEPRDYFWPFTSWDKHDSYLFETFAATLLAAVALWRLRRRREVLFWGLAWALFAYLSLGQNLLVHGRPGAALPLNHFLFTEIFPRSIRAPIRFGMMAALALAVLAALGFSSLAKKGREGRGRGAFFSRNLARGAAALLVLELLILSPWTNTSFLDVLTRPWPNPLLRVDDTRMSVPNVPAPYRRIAEAPLGAALLALPLGSGYPNLGARTYYSEMHFYAALHGLRLFGHEGRAPSYVNHRNLSVPFIRYLGEVESGGAAPDALTPEECEKSLALLGVRYVALHEKLFPPGGFEAARRLFAGFDFCEPLGPEADGVAAYRCDPEGGPILDVRPGLPPDRVCLAGVWEPIPKELDPRSPGTPAARRTFGASPLAAAVLMGPLEPVDGELRARARCLGEACRLTLRWNGLLLARPEIGAGWTELAYDLPARDIQGGANILEFEGSPGPPTPGEEGTLLASHRLVLRSAARGQGGTRIEVDGRSLAPEGRGFLAVALDPRTAEPLAAAAFDTHAEPRASRDLVEFIEKYKGRATRAFAVSDEGARALSDGARLALRGLGARLAGKVGERDSYVLLALPGGAAFEDRGVRRAATLDLGRAGGFAVSRVQFEPANGPGGRKVCASANNPREEKP